MPYSPSRLPGLHAWCGSWRSAPDVIKCRSKVEEVVEENFFYILECAILNAHILDRFVHPQERAQVGRSKRDILEFREDLVDQLIGQGRE